MGQNPQNLRSYRRLLNIVLTGALFLGAACVPPSHPPAGGSDAGVDGSSDPFVEGRGTCQLNALSFGVCTVGEEFRCSTWEHDHCGVCIKVGGEGHWVALGPHAFFCSSLSSCPSVGSQQFFTQWNGPSLCCTCEASDMALRWTCESASSCP